jgi:type IX secretion system PorP/SprF family membrane protein
MKKILAIIALIGAAASATAQQEIMISQYMFNGLVLNPAYAGSHPYWSGTVLAREQWVQFDGRPRTQTLCLDGPLANRKFGVGLNFSNDQIGIVSQQELGLNFSAKIATGRGNLAAGLRLTGALYSTNTGRNDFEAFDPNDPLYTENFLNVFVPKVGFGLYYSERKWFVGLSVPTVAATRPEFGNNPRPDERFFRSHWFLNAGYVFEANRAISIKPSVLLKYQGAAPLQADINCNVLFFQKFWLGLGYRTGSALVGMAEWNVTPQFRIGYAYDYTTNIINNYTNGSHEIMLGYDFGRDVDMKIKSPRYF